MFLSSETVVDMSQSAAPAFRPTATRVAVGGGAAASSVPPVSRADSGGASTKSAGSATVDILSPMRALDRSPALAGTIAGVQTPAISNRSSLFVCLF